MSYDEACRKICIELVKDLPSKEKSKYIDLLDCQQITYIDDLHQGLTMLAISSMELGVLFSRFEREDEVMNHLSIVRRMTVGYLFEVYNSVWEWIGKPVKAICESRNLPLEEFLRHKKSVDIEFSRFIPLLKAIRNGAFHTKEAGNKEWATSATRLLFEKQIPQKLRHSLYEYGYKINIAAHQAKIYGCYPGVGRFKAINSVTGEVLPMQDLYLAGTDIKFTPDFLPQ